MFFITPVTRKSMEPPAWRVRPTGSCPGKYFRAMFSDRTMERGSVRAVAGIAFDQGEREHREERAVGHPQRLIEEFAPGPELHLDPGETGGVDDLGHVVQERRTERTLGDGDGRFLAGELDVLDDAIDVVPVRVEPVDAQLVADP